MTVTVDDGKGGTASDTSRCSASRRPRKEYTFEDVHFDFDRYTLRAEATRILDEAVKAMQADPTLRLTVEGHTCNIGTTEYNLALGERRANAVRDYLASRGIAADRLNTVSYGEERPKHDNSREETRRLNRRAALTVRLTVEGRHRTERLTKRLLRGRPGQKAGVLTSRSARPALPAARASRPSRTRRRPSPACRT